MHMAISITPGQLQPKVEKPAFVTFRSGGGALFAASFLLLFVAALGWLGVEGFAAQLERDISQYNRDLSEVRRSRQPKIEAEVLSTISRARHLEKILDDHRDGRKALAFLEQSVQPGVVFSLFDVDYDAGIIRVSATGPNLTTLAQQIRAFQSDPNVTRVLVGQLTRQQDSDTVETQYSLTLTEGAFRAFVSQ